MTHKPTHSTSRARLLVELVAAFVYGNPAGDALVALPAQPPDAVPTQRTCGLLVTRQPQHRVSLFLKLIILKLIIYSHENMVMKMASREKTKEKLVFECDLFCLHFYLFKQIFEIHNQ